MSNGEAYAYFNNLFMGVGFVECISTKTVHVAVYPGKKYEAEAISELVNGYWIILNDMPVLVGMN